MVGNGILIILSPNLLTHNISTPQGILLLRAKTVIRINPKKNPLLITLDSGAPYPENTVSYKIIHPHFDSYNEHITLRKDKKGRSYHEVITDKGRETFLMCNLIRFSEVICGTSEFIPELGTEIGITNSFSESVQVWLADYDDLNPVDAEIALQALMQKISLR